MNKRFFSLLTAFAVCLGTASSAYADNDRGRGHDNGRGHYHKQQSYKYDRWDNYGRDYRFNGGDKRGHDYGRYQPRRPTVYIPSNDRIVIKKYYATQPVVYRPVGPVYKPAWRVGYSLPHYVTYRPVPNRLLNRLQPIPVGYEYVRVNDDILLITQATRIVLDAITLL